MSTTSNDLTRSETTLPGKDIYHLIEELYPICRSITGEGVRQTLSIMQKHIPLELYEVKTGQQVFDWVVPQEWHIKDAYIKDKSGRKIVDFRQCNLHVVNYSVAVDKTVSLTELREHLHTLPEHPDWIPYRTSYYNPTWGFCLTQRQFDSLEDGDYEVYIDAEHTDGSLTYGEYFIPGESSDEILLFAHCCHPSLCNDNLSGLALSTFLAKHLAHKTLRYSYRFIYTPATIGSITWMSQNEHKLKNIRHGLVCSVVGDPGPMTYKKTRAGDAEIDKAVVHVLQQKLQQQGKTYDVQDFLPWGYDERQFNSPGINLSVGRLTRTPNGCYPEYHTSADNLDLVQVTALQDSYETYIEVFNVLENNQTYINLSPKCEPQLGKRGLYRKTGGHKDVGQRELAYLWVLNMSDGGHSLLDIAERSDLSMDIIVSAASDLRKCNLLALAN